MTMKENVEKKRVEKTYLKKERKKERKKEIWKVKKKNEEV